ncbi:hypothetical protein TNCT_318741 [Trichonephila clavata]|uniref:Uncharacterized protein n=1 Tax=Trichonephila clavata TaxID=2740835 RepID=A0A8X6LEP7_TRICU|nr:hypothetical protein TNCT_318741 [Trichonephila clavata]
MIFSSSPGKDGREPCRFQLRDRRSPKRKIYGVESGNCSRPLGENGPETFSGLQGSFLFSMHAVFEVLWLTINVGKD